MKVVPIAMGGRTMFFCIFSISGRERMSIIFISKMLFRVRVLALFYS